jgi:hypothetical protein
MIKIKNRINGRLNNFMKNLSNLEFPPVVDEPGDESWLKNFSILFFASSNRVIRLIQSAKIENLDINLHANKNAFMNWHRKRPYSQSSIVS